MYFDGHNIIEFAMKRWQLTKKTIAKDYLSCSTSSLSRKNPPRVEPYNYYKRLFDVGYEKSAASVNKESKSNLLRALIDYLIKKDCKREASLIIAKSKKNARYEEIILEVLKMASTQPSKSTSLDKGKNNLPDNIEVGITSHAKDTLPDEVADKVTDQNEPLATISGWDGSSTALDVMVDRLPHSMRDAAQKLRNRQKKGNR